MIHPPKKAEQLDRPPDTRTLPPTFDPAYVEGVVKPFFLSAKYEKHISEKLLKHTISIQY